jgi:hypothetical protein
LHQPFFTDQFFPERNFKTEIELFFRVSITRSEKITPFLVWFFVCSQNYGRITKYFCFHIWNILSLSAIFGENSPFLKKNDRIHPIFLSFLEAQ